MAPVPASRVRAAGWLLVAHALLEAVWTVRLLGEVATHDRALATAIGAGSTLGLALLAALVLRGRALGYTIAVEIAVVGGSVDWLIVFPGLRVVTAGTMAIGAVVLVLLADRRRGRAHGDEPARDLRSDET